MKSEGHTTETIAVGRKWFAFSYPDFLESIYDPKGGNGNLNIPTKKKQKERELREEESKPFD